MPIENHFKLLTLDRQRSINQRAQAWGENDASSSLPDSPRIEAQRPILSGSQLISTLLGSAQVIHRGGGKIFTSLKLTRSLRRSLLGDLSPANTFERGLQELSRISAGFGRSSRGKK